MLKRVVWQVSELQEQNNRVASSPPLSSSMLPSPTLRTASGPALPTAPLNTQVCKKSMSLEYEPFVSFCHEKNEKQRRNCFRPETQVPL